MAPGGLQRNNSISLKQSVFMVGRRCCAAGYASRAAARPYRLVFMAGRRCCAAGCAGRAAARPYRPVFMVGRRCCAAGYAGRAAERPFRLNYMLIIIGNWYQSFPFAPLLALPA